MDLHDRTIIGRTMHHGIFGERLQDQLGNEAGEQLFILHTERLQSSATDFLCWSVSWEEMMNCDTESYVRCIWRESGN